MWVLIRVWKWHKFSKNNKICCTIIRQIRVIILWKKNYCKYSHEFSSFISDRGQVMDFFNYVLNSNSPGCFEKEMRIVCKDQSTNTCHSWFQILDWDPAQIQIQIQILILDWDLVQVHLSLSILDDTKVVQGGSKISDLDFQTCLDHLSIHESIPEQK